MHTFLLVYSKKSQNWDGNKFKIELSWSYEAAYKSEGRKIEGVYLFGFFFQNLFQTNWTNN